MWRFPILDGYFRNRRMGDQICKSRREKRETCNVECLEQGQPKETKKRVMYSSKKEQRDMMAKISDGNDRKAGEQGMRSFLKENKGSDSNTHQTKKDWNFVEVAGKACTFAFNHLAVTSSSHKRRDAARLGAKLEPGVAGSRFHPVSGVASAPCATPLPIGGPGSVQCGESLVQGLVGAVGAFWAALGLQLPYHPQGYLGPAKKGTNELDQGTTIKRCWNWSGKRNMEWMDGGSIQCVARLFCFPCFDTNRGQEYEG
ncbi:hypothetical protein J3E68DRAFT_127543 [Trichoderma sp. SZMC 28012]